jgi:hypothetical protein
VEIVVVGLFMLFAGVVAFIIRPRNRRQHSAPPLSMRRRITRSAFC